MSAALTIGYFFFYSFVGWLMDTSYRSILARAFAPGSFFPVPMCPIYGFGALLVIFLHRAFPSAPLVLQGLIYGVLLALLEYLTGYFALLFFHRRLWYYAGGWLNLGHFTDLSHAVLWGVGAIVLVSYLQPALESVFR